jgi:hypothetical protein
MVSNLLWFIPICLLTGGVNTYLRAVFSQGLRESSLTAGYYTASIAFVIDTNQSNSNKTTRNFLIDCDHSSSVILSIHPFPKTWLLIGSDPYCDCAVNFCITKAAIQPAYSFISFIAIDNFQLFCFCKTAGL